jgi:hypothetical protein
MRVGIEGLRKLPPPKPPPDLAAKAEWAWENTKPTTSARATQTRVKDFNIETGFLFIVLSGADFKGFSAAGLPLGTSLDIVYFSLSLALQ